MCHRIFLIYIVFVLIFIGSGAAASGDEAEIRTSVDKKTISIGDRIRFTVEVGSNNELEVIFPKFENNRIGDFEIKNHQSVRRRTLFGKWDIHNVYEITSYSTGKYIIPPVEITYREKGKSLDWQTKKTPTIGINIESVLPKNEKVYDIKDIKGPLSFYPVKIWVIGFALLIIFIVTIFAVVFYLKRRRRKKIRRADEIAREELDAIRRLFETGGNVKEYHIAISDCVRRYIESRFALKAPEMTTEEFLSSLTGSDSLVASHKDSLNNFLKACDLVKFAKYEPMPEEIDLVFATAAKFVEETKETIGP